MARRSHQLALPIAHIDPPERLLRAAWERCRLQQTFEEAMQVASLRIALRRTAMVMAGGGRWRKKR